MTVGTNCGIFVASNAAAYLRKGKKGKKRKKNKKSKTNLFDMTMMGY